MQVLQSDLPCSFLCPTFNSAVSNCDFFSRDLIHLNLRNANSQIRTKTTVHEAWGKLVVQHICKELEEVRLFSLIFKGLQLAVETL